MDNTQAKADLAQASATSSEESQKEQGNDSSIPFPTVATQPPPTPPADPNG